MLGSRSCYLHASRDAGDLPVVAGLVQSCVACSVHAVLNSREEHPIRRNGGLWSPNKLNIDRRQIASFKRCHIGDLTDPLILTADIESLIPERAVICAETVILKMGDVFRCDPERHMRTTLSLDLQDACIVHILH